MVKKKSAKMLAEEKEKAREAPEAAKPHPCGDDLDRADVTKLAESVNTKRSAKQCPNVDGVSLHDSQIGYDFWLRKAELGVSSDEEDDWEAITAQKGGDVTGELTQAILTAASVVCCRVCASPTEHAKDLEKNPGEVRRCPKIR
jgi:hypothetical protein